MTNYEERVKALRCDELRLSCNECEYGRWSDSGEAWSCEWARLQHDAAAAIEELLESVGMLGEQRSYWIDKAAEYYNQLPKRGEWIDGENFKDPFLGKFRCSVCGHAVQAIEYNYEQKTVRFTCGKSNYCPNCGAKMDGERKEVQE